ncbi:MAG: patatin-like phospholipase family protein [gamma proteobacterium symbiont of Clathrolucina costata]|uniref:Patatin-like phospholipase family protein n=1 Tax=Candidatus Thiodiazotropha taylori TaxID=2792791 RepID=A0A9E4NNB8_9GAMM|nr:patatin-like phospholipase family protein [Candidatus Thiodiazotropha taylori]MCW4238460.1 CBASS cGAMP-activated phospholipase [Candidatus Thiodiazotropha endolucinida]
MKILSIDGGGIRGYFSAYILERIQQELGVEFSEYFDLIAGTSTGSIIAAALAINHPISEVTKLYKDKGKKIFKPRKFSLGGIWKAKYSKSALIDELEKVFGDKTLSSTETRLLIPAIDLVNSQVHVFKSNYLGEFIRDVNVPIKDAVLASCSAPTYFEPTTVDPFLLADGGLWANDPSLVSYVEATGKLKVPPDEVRILSIGSGVGVHYYSHENTDAKWGAITGWGGPQIIDLILNLQSKTAGNMLFHLPKGDYLRLNFKRDYKLSLDDVGILPDLKNIAEQLFADEFKNIKGFFEG